MWASPIWAVMTVLDDAKQLRWQDLYKHAWSWQSLILHMYCYNHRIPVMQLIVRGNAYNLIKLDFGYC